MTYYTSNDPDAKQMQCECDHPDCNDCYPRPVQASTGEVRKPLGVMPRARLVCSICGGDHNILDCCE